MMLWYTLRDGKLAKTYSPMIAAVLAGEFDLVKWFREQGFRWHYNTFELHPGRRNFAGDCIDNGCSVEFLEWTQSFIDSRGDPRPLRMDHQLACRHAMAHGRLDLLEWIVKDCGNPGIMESVSVVAPSISKTPSVLQRVYPRATDDSRPSVQTMLEWFTELCPDFLDARMSKVRGVFDTLCCAGDLSLFQWFHHRGLLLRAMEYSQRPVGGIGGRVAFLDIAANPHAKDIMDWCHKEQIPIHEQGVKLTYKHRTGYSFNLAFVTNLLAASPQEYTVDKRRCLVKLQKRLAEYTYSRVGFDKWSHKIYQCWTRDTLAMIEYVEQLEDNTVGKIQ